MVFWTVMVVMAFVSVAATVITAVYLIERRSERFQQIRSVRRLQNNESNVNVRDKGINKDKCKKNENRPSRPDDRCMICLELMTVETMRFMNCGHAVHDVPCFEDYRQSRRDCPYCEKIVLRLDLPGDNCAICNQTMEEYNMKYVKCQHAFHLDCLIRNNRNTGKCPGCSIQIVPCKA